MILLLSDQWGINTPSSPMVKSACWEGSIIKVLTLTVITEEGQTMDQADIIGAVRQAGLTKYFTDNCHSVPVSIIKVGG